MKDSLGSDYFRFKCSDALGCIVTFALCVSSKIVLRGNFIIFSVLGTWNLTIANEKTARESNPKHTTTSAESAKGGSLSMITSRMK